MQRELIDSRIGIPSKSKAYSTELIEGYDLTDKFEYLPDDSVDRVQQVIMNKLQGVMLRLVTAGPQKVDL